MTCTNREAPTPADQSKDHFVPERTTPFSEDGDEVWLYIYIYRFPVPWVVVLIYKVIRVMDVQCTAKGTIGKKDNVSGTLVWGFWETFPGRFRVVSGHSGRSGPETSWRCAWSWIRVFGTNFPAQVSHFSSRADYIGVRALRTRLVCNV